MANFMYLFWSKDGKSPLDTASPKEVQAMMKKWMAWMGKLEKSGHLKDGGAALESKGKMVHGGKKRVTDGPYAEAKDVVGGYIIVSAKNLAEAVKLSKGCPVLAGDGMVEVRPVRSLKMD